MHLELLYQINLLQMPQLQDAIHDRSPRSSAVSPGTSPDTTCFYRREGASPYIHTYIHTYGVHIHYGMLLIKSCDPPNHGFVITQCCTAEGRAEPAVHRACSRLGCDTRYAGTYHPLAAKGKAGRGGWGRGAMSMGSLGGDLGLELCL